MNYGPDWVQMTVQKPPKEYFAEVAVAQGVAPLEALVPELPGAGEVGLFSNARYLKIVHRQNDQNQL